jgi:hypothetical protein
MSLAPIITIYGRIITLDSTPLRCRLVSMRASNEALKKLGKVQASISMLVDDKIEEVTSDLGYLPSICRFIYLLSAGLLDYRVYRK